MKEILASLVQRAGRYLGQGINHEGQPFTGDLTLTPLVNGRGLSIRFVATGANGDVFHDEQSTLAPAMTGSLALWNFNSNTPSLLQHDLRKTGRENGSQVTYTFGFGDVGHKDSFREEIALDLFENGDVGYRYSWGLPRGDFAPRSGLRMQNTLNAASKRPEMIKHWSEVLKEDNATYPGSDELLGVNAPLGAKTGLKKIGVHRVILKPGRRSSWPHAESHEEEFAYVVSGHPSAWINGELHSLQPGDAVGFPSGTGLAHTFINNTQDDAVLMVVGETTKAENKYIYPMHPKRNEEIGADLWQDCPPQKMGPHDGMPDRLRERK